MTSGSYRHPDCRRQIHLQLHQTHIRAIEEQAPGRAIELQDVFIRKGDPTHRPSFANELIEGIARWQRVNVAVGVNVGVVNVAVGVRVTVGCGRICGRRCGARCGVPEPEMLISHTLPSFSFRSLLLSTPRLAI